MDSQGKSKEMTEKRWLDRGFFPRLTVRAKYLPLTETALNPALGDDVQTSHKGRLVLDYKNISGIRRKEE